MAGHLPRTIESNFMDAQVGQQFRDQSPRISQQLALMQNQLHGQHRIPIPPLIFPGHLLLTLSRLNEDLAVRLRIEAQRSQALWDSLGDHKAEIALYRAENSRLNSRVSELENFLDSQILHVGSNNEGIDREQEVAEDHHSHENQLRPDQSERPREAKLSKEAAVAAKYARFYEDISNSELQARLLEQNHRIQNWRINIPQDPRQLVPASAAALTPKEDLSNPQQKTTESSSKDASAGPQAPSLRFSSRAQLSRPLSDSALSVPKPTWSEIIRADDSKLLDRDRSIIGLGIDESGVGKAFEERKESTERAGDPQQGFHPGLSFVEALEKEINDYRARAHAERDRQGAAGDDALGLAQQAPNEPVANLLECVARVVREESEED